MSLINLIKKINENSDNLDNLLSNSSIKELTDLIEESNHFYHEEGQPILSDSVYDQIKDYLSQKDPNNPTLSQIGSEIKGDNKVRLPYYLGSMDKIKPSQENLINKWTDKYRGPYCLSSKLDGISILVIFSNNKIECYTRGTGIIGRDVSYLSKIINFKNIYNNIVLNKFEKLSVRGELLISKSNFVKYQNEFENSRNTIAGIMNKKVIHDIKVNFKDIDFVAFELLEPRMNSFDQFELLTKLGFKTPIYEMVDSISVDTLTNKLISYRSKSKWEMDGIIVTDNKNYPINQEKNPKYSFAFKIIDETAITTVIDVLWNKSRNGYLNPRIFVEKIKISGCTIQYVSGKNAKYIKDNQIGPGAKLKIIRSGEVIPEIVEIIKPASNPKYPKEYYEEKCKWSSTGVDLILSEFEEDRQVKLEVIIHFFRSINTKNISSGIITKIFDNGYDSIPKILNLKVEQLEMIDGFKSKLSEKIITNINESIKHATLINYMVGSNCFGRGLGEKKLKLIFDNYPNILLLNESKEILKNKIMLIDGFSDKTSDLFVDNIIHFKKFIQQLPIKINISPTVKDKDTLTKNNLIFKDQKIVLTKFRDNQISNYILNQGGVIEENVTKQTNLLLIDNLDSSSGKRNKAESLGIKVLSRDQFINKYLK